MTETNEHIRQQTQAVYQRNAAAFDAQRPRVLFERPWLDRLLAHVPVGGTILDVGCGAGEPIARYLSENGRVVTGVDFSVPMLAIARRRLPHLRWIEADMRRLALGERFAGIVAWNSFFHLGKDEQRAVIPLFAKHLLPGGALLLTVGPSDGEAIGHVADDEVYHASLAFEEYQARLGAVGLRVEQFVAEDADCDLHSVLLAVADP